jgi:phosphohistidine swiveling domain-containing protein
MREKIKLICEKIAESFAGTSDKGLWPLYPLQAFTYFDAALVEDTIKVIELLKQKYSLEEIANMIDSPNQLITHFSQIAITRIKELKTLGKISDEEIDEHLGGLIKIIEIKGSLNSLMNNKNLLNDKKEIEDLKQKNFIESKEEDKKAIGLLRVTLMALVYSLYTDYFTTAGQAAYGPYEFEELKGKKVIVYHFKNLKPVELHPESSILPFKEIKIITVRNSEDIGFNFIMQQIGDFSPKTIEKHYIEIDGKEANLSQVLQKLDVFHEIITVITEKINKMEDLEKVRFIGKVAQYNIKSLREKALGNWYNPNIYEKKISAFGNLFIEKNKPESKGKITKDNLWPFLDPYVPFEDFSDIFANQLKGISASPGKALGDVVVVETKEDLFKIKQGNILVAKFTEPSMVVAMTKVAAIVIDYGGITAHAAIISRELGVPCIVGTESATKVLKSGTLVKVDADEGIVYY